MGFRQDLLSALARARLARQAAHRAALRTALGLVLHLRPRTRLLAGRLLHLTEGPGEDERLARERLPQLLRPYALTLPAGAPLLPADVLEDVTGLIGPA